jgi:hypothetical protein
MDPDPVRNGKEEEVVPNCSAHEAEEEEDGEEDHVGSDGDSIKHTLDWGLYILR